MTEITSHDLEKENEPMRFLDGSMRWRVELSTMYIGKGTYQPGWRWSLHARPLANKPSESHIGLVESGRFVIKGSDGIEVTIGAGEVFEVTPDYDAWVLGDEPCIALDFEPK
jgi:hypothetical protein